MRPPDDNTATLTLNNRRAEEDRMRVTLGLPSEPHPSRPAGNSPLHPVRDRERPVASASGRRLFEAPDPSRARLAALLDEMRAERGERIAAQQALADAQQIIRRMQAQLAHTEMAAAEALAAEHKARLDAEARLGDRPPAAPPGFVPEKPAAPKRRGRPPTKRLAVAEAEPQPVEWWLPSYKASRAKPSRLKR